MGSVAEPVMIELVLTKSSVLVEAHLAIEVLTEIGGPRSVPALRKAMESQRTKPMAEAALAAIAKREGLSVEKLLAQAPRESPIKPKPRGPSTTGFRTWKDSTGRFEIEAQLVAASDGVITLRKRDGETVDVPLKRLSRADQDVIAGREQLRPPSRSKPLSPAMAAHQERLRRTPAMAAHQERVRRMQDRVHGVSENTVIVGGPGGGPFRRIDPRGLPILGVRCRLGDWRGKPTVKSIEPIHDRIARHPFPVTVMSREGYALGAIQVDADDQVRAVRLAFMRIDGDKLDTTDSYVSEWIGTPTGGEPVVLNGNGKPILGFIGRLSVRSMPWGLSWTCRETAQPGGPGRDRRSVASAFACHASPLDRRFAERPDSRQAGTVEPGIRGHGHRRWAGGRPVSTREPAGAAGRGGSLPTRELGRQGVGEFDRRDLRSRTASCSDNRHRSRRILPRRDPGRRRRPGPRHSAGVHEDRRRQARHVRFLRQRLDRHPDGRRAGSAQREGQTDPRLLRSQGGRALNAVGIVVETP